jgi:hypothetical protein
MAQDRTSGQAQWSAFIDTLAEGGAEVYRAATPGRSVEEQSQVTQALTWALIAELQSLATIDRDHPRWLTLLNQEMRRFNSNADNTYEVAYIRGSGIYRIFGKRGTTRLMYLQVGAGTLGVGDLARHKMLGDLNVDDCEIADDGTFEVILSAQRPTGYTGAWMQLDPTRDDSFVWVRQVSYDWLNEIDGQLSIMRIDLPIAKRELTARQFADNLVFTAESVRDDVLAMLRVMNEQIEGVEVNQFADVSGSFGSAGISGQAYTHGVIQLAEDEAWIAECVIPEGCIYWSVQLMDYAYSALNGMYAQTSINGHTAVGDPDGVVRIVVSATDTGAANWLDTLGLERVQIRFRWLASAAPVISPKVVRLDQLDQALPADTARVTADQRQDALRKRVIGQQWRRR